MRRNTAIAYCALWIATYRVHPTHSVGRNKTIQAQRVVAFPAFGQSEAKNVFFYR
jgi:hypothetical protein